MHGRLPFFGHVPLSARQALVTWPRPRIPRSPAAPMGFSPLRSLAPAGQVPRVSTRVRPTCRPETSASANFCRGTVPTTKSLHHPRTTPKRPVMDVSGPAPGTCLGLPAVPDWALSASRTGRSCLGVQALSQACGHARARCRATAGSPQACSGTPLRFNVRAGVLDPAPAPSAVGNRFRSPAAHGLFGSGSPPVTRSDASDGSAVCEACPSACKAADALPIRRMSSVRRIGNLSEVFAPSAGGAEETEVA
jgi:hypothetical protein